jgi:arylsulfatase
VYVLDDEVWFVYNDGRGLLRECSGGRIVPGSHRIELVVTAPGGVLWDAQLLVDREVTGALGGLTMLFGMVPFEGIDVGIDRRSPVSWSIYERFGPFPFTGALHSVRYVPGAFAPDAPENVLETLREMGRRFE